MTTFAVIGHNEERFLEESIRQTQEAAGPGDEVWFVDSGSTDGSAALAARLGADVMTVAAGKGRGVAAALARQGSGPVCFVDADIEWSEANIPAQLAAADEADLVVADFDWREKRFLANTVAVYNPLVAGLFPEAAGRFGPKPFSGFRRVRAELPLGPLPPGFAVEAYTNVKAVLAGASVEVIDLGGYKGPLRNKSGLGWEIGQALLDLAERTGRLSPSLRPLWNDWLAGAMEVVAARPPGDKPPDGYVERLQEAAARPLPAAHV